MNDEMHNKTQAQKKGLAFRFKFKLNPMPVEIKAVCAIISGTPACRMTVYY